MTRFETSKGDTTIRNRSKRHIATASAGLVLATSGMAGADHYPNVPARVQRKDRAVIDAIARMTYAEPYEITLVEECNCLEPTCDGGFMLSCGGEIVENYQGLLSTVRRTSRQTCLVCGCADYATLRATPVCLGF
jgi:hypothetical protein